MNIYSNKNTPIGSYVYAYLREDLTPYYIGKGKGPRAWKRHVRGNGTNLLPKDNNKITILAHRLSDSEACTLEKKLILQFGRKDLGTGILRNLSDGGDGTSGRVVSELTRKKKSQKLQGRKIGPHSEERKLAIKNGLPKNKIAHNKGKPISKKQLAQLNQLVECPNCHKIGPIGAMSRWHFNNCKFK